MAVTFKEFELLKPGSQQDTPDRISYTGNMYVRNNALEVRQGFGQIAQLDTTLGMPDTNDALYGFQKNLASTVIKTNFGHTQFVTITQNRSYTGETLTRGQWGYHYSLVVWDETTRKQWEVVLHRHTGEFNPDVVPMSSWVPTYQTSRDQDRQSFETSATSPAEVWMQEFNGNLMFGSTQLGLWAYVPSDFSSRRRQQVDGIKQQDYCSTYGESSLVFRVQPQPGLFSASRQYLDTAGFPQPQDCTVFRKRLVMIRGREVFFSDESTPNSIAGLNSFTVSSTQELTAVAECNGSLLLFSPRETWLYRAPIGSSTPAQGGELIRISDSVGCLGSQAKCRFEDRVVWASSLGIHVSQGNLETQTVSEDIQELFEQQLSKPLTHYYQNQGTTDLSATQPTTYLDWEPGSTLGCNFAYDPHYRRILCSLPLQRTILCLQDGKWGFWSVESMCQTSPSQVGALQNIENPRVLCLEGEVYLVAGADNYTPVDLTVKGRVDTPMVENSIESSLYILQLGHGGALDRSSAPLALEDNRVFAYWQELEGDSTVNRYFQIQEPHRLPAGYTFPRGSVVGSTDYTYLFPIVLVPKDGTHVDHYHLTFDFDNSKWEPILNGITPELDYIVATERESSKYGYGWGAPVATTAEVQVYSNTLFVPQVGGGRITINWDGVHGTGIQPWSYANTMNLNSRCVNPLLYIPMRMKAPTVCSMSLGLGLVQAYVMVGGVASVTPLWYAHSPHIPLLTKTTDMGKAQPVDWCFKSEHLGLKGQEQVVARSLYSILLTHGKGSAGLYPNWLHGMFNATCSSDWKDYCSQIVDFQGDITDDADKETLRQRLEDAGEMAMRNFNQTVRGPRWSSTADTTKGNFLIGDEELNTVAISDSTRGEYVSWMLYGHQRDPAERLVLESVKASLKAVAGRRRFGR